MAVDIRNYLEHRPLLAAPESKRYLVRKFISRHSTSIVAATVLLVLLVGGVVGTSMGLLREQAARRIADENGRRATWSAYRSAIVAAEVALQNGDAIRLRQAIDAAPAELRGWEWKRIAHSGSTFASRLRTAPGDLFKASYALADNRRAISSTDTLEGNTVLWDLQTGEILRREAGGRVAIDPSGGFYVIVRPDGALELVELESGKPRWRVAPSSSTKRPWQIVNNSVSADGMFICAWDGSDQMLGIIGSETGQLRSMNVGVVIDRIHGFIQVGDEHARVHFGSKTLLGILSLDIDTGVTERDARYTITLGRQPLVNAGPREWRPVGSAQDIPIYDIGDSSLPVWLSVYLPKRQLLASGREDGSVEIIAPRQGTGSERARRLRADNESGKRQVVAGSAPVNMISVTPDESRLIVTLRNGEIGVLPVDPPPAVSVLMSGLVASTLSPDRKKLAGVGWGDIYCVDVLTGLPLWGRNLGPRGSTHIAWSPDGSRVIVTTDPLASADHRSDVFILDGRTGDQLAAWCDSPVTFDPAHGPESPTWAKNIAGLEFNRNGSTLFVARFDGTISSVDPTTWTERAEASNATPAETIPPASFVPARFAHRGVLEHSPDGKLLAQLTIRYDDDVWLSGPLLLRDSVTGKRLKTIDIPGYGATAFAWDSNASLLAVSFSNGNDSLVSVIDVASGRERFRKLTTSTSTISALTFSDASDRVLAFTIGRRMVVLDAASGEEIVSSFTPTIQSRAFATTDGAVALSGGGYLLQRMESRNPPATSLVDILLDWPSGVARPSSVDQARRLVGRANQILLAAYDSALPVEAFVEQSLADDPYMKSLVLHLKDRFPPNINLLNSSALSRMLVESPEAGELERAEAMLRKATAIKPHSPSLQSNFGTTLFMEGKYDKCIEPLLHCEQLLQERDAPPSAANLLRLAIACAKIGDARMTRFFDSAKHEIEKQSLGTNPEIAPLLMQASALIKE
jgi:hypothetical protein